MTKVIALGLFCALVTSACSKGSSSPTVTMTPSPEGTNPFNTDASLNEYVAFIPAHLSDGDFELETTMYHPNTPAPWPLVVINHGQDPVADFHQQGRFRPTELAKFFLSRGYLVAVPMREGFARSGGKYSSIEHQFKCNYTAWAEFYAQNISQTIAFLVATGQAKKDEVLVMGQSAGGLVTLGYGASSARAAKALINISGGSNLLDGGCNWQTEMVNEGANLGASTQVPAFWMYAADDKTFPPSISQPFFNNYKGAGANASYKLYPSGGHAFALTAGSASVWGADIDLFLKSVGLPNQLQTLF